MLHRKIIVHELTPNQFAIEIKQFSTYCLLSQFYRPPLYGNELVTRTASINKTKTLTLLELIKRLLTPNNSIKHDNRRQ